MHSPTRRSFLKTMGTGLAATLFLSAWQCSQHKQPPNFVFIIGDDISFDDFGCYGHPSIRTPNIDKLAQQGVRFTNAFLTASSCSPSRCSIISGRYPHNTGAAELHTELPQGILPFPQRLQEHGYYCAQGGKWHMGQAPRSTFAAIKDKWAKDDPGAEKMWVPLLQNRPKDKPFFMWFASTDAHRDWDEQIFLEKHDPAQVPIPKYLADAAGTRQDVAHYYDEIARLDFYVGEIEKELAKQGVADNTVIIFTADNGRPFPRCKTRVYDSGMKTPFVVKWPAGMPHPQSVCESLISVIDMAPTILELAGIPIEENFQGKSFAPLLKNPQQKFRNYVFSEHNWHDHEALERMVRSNDFLYVLNERPQFPNSGPADAESGPSQADLNKLQQAGQLNTEQADVFLAPRPREELFDLRTDAEQFHNIAGQAEYADILQEMRQVMQQWRDETADSTPEQLTKDWYERFTGKALAVEHVRGEMPGASRQATTINNKGPF